MSRWPEVRLDDLVQISGGGTPDRSVNEYYGGEIPWVTPKDMKTWEIFGAQENLTEQGAKNSTTRLIEPNSILIVTRSGVLKHTLPVALNRVRVAINQDIKALRCDARVSPDFLARFLKAKAYGILGTVRATTADNIPTDVLRNLLVPLPPIGEQCRIVDVLNRADCLRTKRRDSLALLNDISECIFVDVFGPIQKQNELWPIRRLEDVVRETKLGLVRSSEEFGDDPWFKVPYVRMNSITRKGQFDPTTVLRTNASVHECSDFALKPGDVLFNTRNSRELVGKTALFRELGLYVFNNNIMRIRVTPEIDAEYLATAFRTPHLQHELEIRKSGTTSVFAIYWKDLRSLPIPIPPIRLQHEFKHKVHAVERMKALQCVSLTGLDMLFSSLQHRAFRGEL